MRRAGPVSCTLAGALRGTVTAVMADNEAAAMLARQLALAITTYVQDVSQLMLAWMGASLTLIWLPPGMFKQGVIRGSMCCLSAADVQPLHLTCCLCSRMLNACIMGPGGMLPTFSGYSSCRAVCSCAVTAALVSQVTDRMLDCSKS